MKLITPLNVFGNLYKNAKRLLVLAWREDKKLTFAFYAVTAIGATTPILASVAMKFVIDNIQSAQSDLTTNIPFMLVAVLGAYYFTTIFQDVVYYGYGFSYIDYLFRYKIQNAVSHKFYTKVSSLDIAHFEDPKTQDLITKARDTMLWRVPDFLRFMRDLTANAVGYISALVVLVSLGWWIPLLITLVTLPRIYLRSKYGALQWSIYGSGAPRARKLWYMGWLLQEPTSIKEMRIFQSTKAILAKSKQVQQELYELNKKPLDRFLRVRNYPIIIETAILFAISYYFLPQVLGGAITIGTFTLLINLSSRLNAEAAGGASRIGELYESSLYVDNYFDTLNLPRLVADKPNAIRLKIDMPPKIEFKDVDFAYPRGETVLKNISFTIDPGESVAFVGHNGAGKSTLVKLLCRFYDVTAGEILVNGKNLKDLKLVDWYKQLGTLFQEFTHYHFTVRENITLGNPSKDSESAMISAAKKAGAHDFISKLPKGYDTKLGRGFSKGEELSVGQWQKLAIARSFYEQPPVLILDEPTSAIDAEAEYDIFTNLQKQYQNKTLILVSHRFSTVRNANKIIVIEEGEITENGTHEELMKLNGKYSRMFAKQAEGYK